MTAAARPLAVLLCSLGFAAPALAQESAADAAETSSWVDSLKWRSIGPANMGGRMISIAVYDKDPTMFWVATASGGLLKTTNNGITFEHQFDHESTVSLGAVAVAQSDPNIVWVGTGEYSPRNSVSYGDGVYKSVDGGKTWKNMGLEESFQTGDIVIHPRNPDVVYVGALGRLYGPNEQRGLYKTTDGGETWKKVHYVDDKTGVIDIAMHPQDPDTLIFATYERQRDGFDGNDPAKKIAPGSGLWKTTDGGQTFKKLTKGLPTVDLGRVGIDWYQKDPKVVYAIVESALIAKPGEKVGWPGFDAEDAETGAKVTRITKDSPAAKAGLKEGDIVLGVGSEMVLTNMQMLKQLTQREIGEKVELKVARGDEYQDLELTLTKQPEPAEGSQGGRGGGRGGFRGRRGGGLRFTGSLGGQAANLQDMQGKNGFQHGGVYRSADGGASWTRINTINPRPMYFSCVRIDPTDEDHQYVLGISGARSSDRGVTYTSDFTRGVHADQHAMWIDPKDGRHMRILCDGGLYVTHDRGANWDHLNHLALGQFYHVGLGPRRDYWVYGGLQDNGSWGAPHRAERGSGAINSDWIRVGGGDGFLCLVDPNDPEQIYYESQNGSTGRTHLGTMEAGRMRPQAPEGTRYRFNWRTPFILSNANSRIYYSAGNHVFRSLDRGNDLKAISPEITRTDRGSATALSESPRNPDVLYVGTDDGALWMTRNGGKDWIDLWMLEEAVGEGEGESADSRGGPSAIATGDPAPLGQLVPSPRWVSGIEASRYKTGRVYLSLDGHRSDDDKPYVLVSENYGKTWRSIRANLPRGSTRCVREDIENADVIYAGTEFGIWVTLNRGEEWTHLNGNLPTVAIHEIAQHPLSGEIVVATHGRSLWIVDATPIRQLKAEVFESDTHLFEPNDVVVWRTKHRRAGSGTRRFTGENPSNTAELFYYLKRNANGAKLAIHDLSGKLVRSLEADGAAGVHRVTWRLDRNPPEGQTDPRARFRQFGGRGRRFGRGGRSVPAGTYKVVLEVGGETFEQTFEVQSDPNFPAGSGPGREEFDEGDEDGEHEAIDR